MNRAKEFDNVLNECIERMLKGESVEACLAAYPEYAAALEPLLRTALDTRKAASIMPRPEFRQRAGYEFQAAIRDLVPPKKQVGFRWQVRLVTALSVVVIILIAGTGTVAAASNSLPDGPLYPVKLFTENVRLVLTPSDLGKAELYSEYADTRVKEIIQMADKGNVEQVVKTTGRMNDNLVAVAKLIQPGGVTNTSGEGAPQALMSAAAANATQPPIPARVMPTPAPVQGDTSAKAPTATIKTAPVPATQTAKAVTSNVSKTGAAEIKANAHTELKNTVSSRAAKNTQDLQEALKRVPDSVKPALEKAIEDAAKGYEEALKNKEQNKK
jgi:hypothetical protein